MVRRSIAFALPAVAAVTMAVATATAAPAAADGTFATQYSLTQGACVAQVQTSVNGDAYPEHAALTVSTIMFGIGPCQLPVTLNWTNVATGETGSTGLVANGPGHWMNSGGSGLFRPGIGKFTATITLGAAHVPQSGTVEFEVTEYQ